MKSSYTKEGDRQFTATAFLVSEENPKQIVFLLHKKLGVWLPPGGHIELQEDPIQAVIRETQEETGIDITPYISKPSLIDERAKKIPLPMTIVEEYIDKHGVVPAHFHVDLVYKVVVPRQEVRLQREEHHDVRWFTQEEFAQVTTFKNVSDIASSLYQS